VLEVHPERVGDDRIGRADQRAGGARGLPVVSDGGTPSRWEVARLKRKSTGTESRTTDFRFTREPITGPEADGRAILHRNQRGPLAVTAFRASFKTGPAAIGERRGT
jgi:hypothetical protein